MISNKKLSFSVIITCYNALSWLERCLTSLSEQTYQNFEIIFVDDGSADDSLAFVKNKFPHVIIVESLKNVGFARANNMGAAVAKGQYLFILNADTYLDSDTLQKTVDYIIEHPKHAYLQLDIRKYDKSNMTGEPCIFGMDTLGYPIWKGNGRPYYADAAAMVIRRSLFFTLKGFDEAFFIYLEDLDLAWRARLIGEQIYFVPHAYVYHFAGGTSVSTQNKKGSYTTSLRRRFDAQKNNIRALLKNYSLQYVLWTVPISCIMAFIEGWFYLAKGNVLGFFALHRAVFWNVLNIRDTLSERKKIQHDRIVSDVAIIGECDKRISKLHSFFLFGVPSMKK